ncbi:nucleotide exchange factor GrpE [Streptosporangium sp. NPDC004631]
MSRRSERGEAAARRQTGGGQTGDRETDAWQPGTQEAGDREAAPEETAPEAAGPEERIAGLQAQVADLEGRWKRALADLDNLRKRVSRDAGRVRAEERARAAAEWLPVLDNLDRALEHAGTDPASIVEGLRAVHDQALDVLARLGFPRRDDTGTTFDPARHEAVGVLTQEGTPDGTVIHVVQPAYGEGERQLRPALVVVSKAE